MRRIHRARRCRARSRSTCRVRGLRFGDCESIRAASSCVEAVRLSRCSRSRSSCSSISSCNRQRAVAKQELLDALVAGHRRHRELADARREPRATRDRRTREGATSAIRTLPRMGYRFVAPVREADDAGGPARRREAAAARRDLRRPRGSARRAGSAPGSAARRVSARSARGKAKRASARRASRASSRRARRKRGRSSRSGRCPGARGAPAFWPWIQVAAPARPDDDASALRAALGPGAAEIASLVPRCARRADPDRCVVPSASRSCFLLCDGMASLLAHASRERPLLVLLDDLALGRSAVAVPVAPPRAGAAQRARDAARDGAPSEHEPGEPLAETLADLNRQDHCRVLASRGPSRRKRSRASSRRAAAAARPPTSPRSCTAAYRWLKPPAFPFSLIVRHGEGDWHFSAANGGTRIDWEYTFELTSPLAWPLAAAVMLIFRRWMQRALLRARSVLTAS